MHHRVVIRVDASARIGFGHLMRCLVLADGFLERGSERVHFICRGLDKKLEELVVKAGHCIHHLQQSGNKYLDPSSLHHADWLGVSLNADADETADALEKLRPDCLVVDHYAIGATWERKQRQHVKKIVVIDDLADREHDCDVLIDPNFYLDLKRRYDRIVPKNCQKLLGPRYALLGQEFLLERKRVRPRDGAVKRVCVSFGGVDLENFTLLAVEALLSFGGNFEVDVVVGSGYPHLRELREKCSQHANVHLYVQTQYMARLLAQADFAIGACGSTSWERCCLGVPALLFSLASNQNKLLEDMCEAGYVLGVIQKENITPDQMRSLIQAALLSPPGLRGLSQRSLNLIDGKGLARVLSILSNKPVILLRHATEEDCVMAWRWRNAKATTQYFFDQTLISFEVHREWWQCSLLASDKALLVGVVDNVSSAILRLDISDKSAMVSIYLDPVKVGSGIGSNLLMRCKEWVVKNFPEVERLDALIKTENIVSRSCFLSSGFKERYSCFSLEISKP